MSFTDRTDFIGAASSEKITLAHVQATSRLYNWTVFSGNIYSRQVDYFAFALKQENTSITQVFSFGLLGDNTWFYEIDTGTVYLNLAGTDPQTVEMIVTYKFFYSDAPVTASWDLTDTGDHVYYSARIEESPGFKHKVGIDQKLVSVVGQGDLKLENNDGALDEIFDTLIFENQSVEIYSWNRDLDFSESKILYRGRVTNKRFNTERVTFTVKDLIYDLLQDIPLEAYDDDDNVTESVKGQYKRWLYGRVDGLKLQSVDQIGDGFTLTGTASGTAESSSIVGTGTNWIADCSPGDTITFGTQEFRISQVLSNVLIIVDDEVAFSFTDLPVTLRPEIPTTNKNREFFVAGHATAKLTKTLTSVTQLNRVVLDDTTGLQAGDFIEFATAERVEIKNLAPGNIVVLRNNLITIPTLSTDVVRQPIQDIFVAGERVAPDKFTIANSSVETKVTLDSDVEFQIATTENFGFSATFTNGSATITTANDIDLTQVLSPRDYIRPDNVTYSTFYEILSVDTQSLTIRTSFADPTITDDAEGKRPNYIGDDTVVHANVLGRTTDNQPDGTWITTGSQAIRDLLTQSSITNVNETSFTTAATTNSELLSIAIPLTPQGAVPSNKAIIDKITKSITQALTLDNSLDLQLRTLLPEVADDPVIIRDSDVVDWSISSVNGDLIRNALINYRHQDIVRSTQEAGSNTQTYTSEFVEKYVGTNVTSELDIYLYNERSARIMAHREIYLRSLARAEMRVRTDLRLEDIEIGDVVIADFDRLYKRFGDNATAKKSMLVVGKTIDGQKMELWLTDYGNTLNRTSIITPNTAPDWASASDDEKIKYGYITENDGIINDEEDTSNTHLIT